MPLHTLMFREVFFKCIGLEKLSEGLSLISDRRIIASVSFYMPDEQYTNMQCDHVKSELIAKLVCLYTYQFITNPSNTHHFDSSQLACFGVAALQHDNYQHHALIHGLFINRLS